MRGNTHSLTHSSRVTIVSSKSTDLERCKPRIGKALSHGAYTLVTEVEISNLTISVLKSRIMSWKEMLCRGQCEIS